MADVLLRIIFILFKLVISDQDVTYIAVSAKTKKKRKRRKIGGDKRKKK